LIGLLCKQFYPEKPFFYFTSIVKKWILPSLTSLVNLLKNVL
jgi:hypothetical protein